LHCAVAASAESRDQFSLSRGRQGSLQHTGCTSGQYGSTAHLAEKFATVRNFRHWLDGVFVFTGCNFRIEPSPLMPDWKQTAALWRSLPLIGNLHVEARSVESSASKSIILPNQ